MIFEPFPQQKEAIDLAVKNCEGFALFADPGFGKTAVMLEVLNRLCFTKTLIIAPLRVCYNVWPQEIEKWDSFKHFSIQILHGKNRKSLDQKTDLCIINSENLRWQFEKFKLDFDTLIIDESSQFKNFSSQRFKMVKRRLNAFKNKFLLTGTPAPNGLIDIFAQMFLVDKTLLGDTIGGYRDKYFNARHYQNYTRYEIRNEKSADKIYERIAPKCYRADSSGIKLPGIDYHTLWVELPTDARQRYAELEKALFTEIDGDEIQKNVKYNTLRQVCQGFLYGEDNFEVYDLHDEKLNAFVELVSELAGKPILVAYHYKEDLKKLLRKFPKAPVLGGGTTPRKATQIINDWNEGKTHVLFAHPQSMSMGLNLQHGPGRSICWYSPTDSLERHIQYNKRLHRQGVKGGVNVYYIAVRNSIDEAILKGLQSKEKTQKAMLDAVESYRKARL